MKYRLADHVMLYNDELNQESYLFNLENNETYLLNDISTFIIQCIEDLLDYEIILDSLYQMVKYQIKYDVLKKDVDVFISKIKEKGFVESE